MYKEVVVCPEDSISELLIKRMLTNIKLFETAFEHVRPRCITRPSNLHARRKSHLTCGRYRDLDKLSVLSERYCHVMRLGSVIYEMLVLHHLTAPQGYMSANL